MANQERGRERAAGQEERQRLEADLESQLKETGRLRTTFARARDVDTKLETRDAEAKNLTAKLGARERNIQALKKSTSWRITRPLRAVSRSLRWLVRTIVDRRLAVPR